MLYAHDLAAFIGISLDTKSTKATNVIHAHGPEQDFLSYFCTKLWLVLDSLATLLFIYFLCDVYDI